MIPDFSGLSCDEVKSFIHSNLRYCIDHRIAVTRRLKKDPRKGVSSLSEVILKEYESYRGNLKHGMSMFAFDREYGILTAGTDEVGRGPLAGPIVGACVVFEGDRIEELSEDFILMIDDSKKLTREKRQFIEPKIREYALSYSISLCTNKEIDEMGIAHCNNRIFLNSFNSLKVKPEVILSDGFFIKDCPIRNERIIKGDMKSAAIACASILAKEYRDNLMKEYHNIYPQYSFEENVGYGTKAHVEAIKKYGITDIHRKSFLRGILGEDIFSGRNGGID